jgi:miniconductance mechanosensitive channel
VLEFATEWFAGLGISEPIADVLARVLVFVVIVALSLLADLVAKRLIVRTAERLIARSKTTWDDAILRRDALTRLSRLAPAIVFYLLSPLALDGYPSLMSVAAAAVQLYAIVVVVLVLSALLSAAMDVYETFEIADQIPIKSFVQVARLLLYFLGGLIFLSVILDKTPLILLSGLGAFTAILIIVFRDAILGFVAGIQLTANRMIARGDWIEMPKYGADGDVIEVSLTTVKVQNWDKTITTIPTYALISESFKNWRGMSDSRGRRIKRAVNIDIGTIRFCTEEMLERFGKIQFISEYIERKMTELAEHNEALAGDNEALAGDNETPANNRRLTNIGTFRAYVLAYLRNHPKIHKDMTFLVRQLKPSEHGVPLEIYVFSNEIAWVEYEAIQADIFDHILAVAPEFDLRVFQSPAGADLRDLAAAAVSA